MKQTKDVVDALDLAKDTYPILMARAVRQEDNDLYSLAEGLLSERASVVERVAKVLVERYEEPNAKEILVGFNACLKC